MKGKILFVIPIFFIGYGMGTLFHSAEWQLNYTTDFGYGVIYLMLSVIVPLIMSFTIWLVRKKFPYNFFLIASYICIGMIYLFMRTSDQGLMELYYMSKNTAISTNQEVQTKNIGLGVGNSAVRKSQSIREGWVKLEEQTYSIMYPDDWILDRSGHLGIDFIIAPKDAAETLASINLVTDDISGYGIGLDEYFMHTKGFLNSTSADIIVIEKQKTKDRDDEYYRIIYSTVLFGRNMSYLQHYRASKTNAYVLTYGCDFEAFEKYLELMEEVMQTFRVRH